MDHDNEELVAVIKKDREPAPIRNLYVTSLSYNAFTLTDGALRLIVLLHANSLGFGAIEIAVMFSFYEVAGIFTNLFGGVAGSKFGLFFILSVSIILQVLCLGALMGVGTIFGDLKNDEISSAERLEATIYITAFQSFSGIAKDLMKLAGKGTPKLVTKEGAEGNLFRIVAWLTGMKNAVKGFGSFLGAVLVAYVGFKWSLLILICTISIFLPVAILYMDKDLGRQPVKKINWSSVFHKGHDVNVLSTARFWLFGSRDIWFEIGLPIFLKNGFGWDATYVGLMMAGYIVIYGNLQAASTNMYKAGEDGVLGRPEASSVARWAFGCSIIPLITGTILFFTYDADATVDDPLSITILLLGLISFAAVFAVNSAIHSYLIVSYSDKDKVAMDLGFYYMANACGRLIGVLLGGVVYHFSEDKFGLSMCLWIASPFLWLASFFGLFLNGAPWGPSAKTKKLCTIKEVMRGQEEGIEITETREICDGKSNKETILIKS